MGATAYPEERDAESFLAELSERRLLIVTGVPGVYGRGGAFEDVLQRCAAIVTRLAVADECESMRFPPVLPRHDLERVGYLRSFPHLAGSVFAFSGSEADAAEQFARASRHEDWSEFQTMTDLALTPAACYPVYPAIAARGPLPPGGAVVDAGSAYVFRREPDRNPARMQMFHQRELVRIGEPEAVRAWRSLWRERALTSLRGIGLDVEVELASDPFFGRAGKMLAATQRELELKFELTVPITGLERTAVVSFNYHEDHFSSVYGIEFAAGGPVHTACLGFGLERVTLALFSAHGFELERWPTAVRNELWPA